MSDMPPLVPTRFTSARARLGVTVALLLSAPSANGQTVTTASMTGVVRDAQGAVIPGASISAVHEPSGTTYEAVTQVDGRFTIPGMRVGGPYKVTASLQGFTNEEKNNINLQLGVAQDLDYTLKVATLSETITVIGQSDPVFSSGRTGAATAVMREDLAALPTISGRITDITRLTPQYGGNGSLAGQDNRANNMTVDGAYFNNSFGLGVTTGGIGDRTGVAPISLEAIEQVQVSVAPYDVRQGSFTGAGINTVTRSGTNNFTASGYYRTRNESCSDLTNVDTCSGFVGTTASGNRVNPGNFTTHVAGVTAGGPIVKNKLFAFGAYEKQTDTRPLTTFTSNPGGAPVAGNTTRVKVVKNKVAPPFKQVEFDIMYGEGISKIGEILDLGVKAGLVEKSGAWFSYDSIRIGQGRENAKLFLKENVELAERLEAAIRGRTAEVAEEMMVGSPSEDEDDL